MKNSQIALGALVIAVIAAVAFYVMRQDEPAKEDAAEAPAEPVTTPENDPAKSPDCTQYTLKAGAWVCTSGH